MLLADVSDVPLFKKRSYCEEIHFITHLFMASGQTENWKRYVSFDQVFGDRKEPNPLFSLSGRLLTEFSVCKMCLGSLENADSNETISRIVATVKELDFEYDDFKIAFYVSPCIFVRKLYFYNLIDQRCTQ